MSRKSAATKLQEIVYEIGIEGAEHMLQFYRALLKNAGSASESEQRALFTPSKKKIKKETHNEQP